MMQCQLAMTENNIHFRIFVVLNSNFTLMLMHSNATACQPDIRSFVNDSQ